MHIKNKVTEIVSEFGTNNPFEIIDILDIILVLHPLHNSINGFFQVKDDYPIIYINDNLCFEEKIMTAAHELAHYYLHKGTNYFACSGFSGSYIKNKYERQAYIFAAELLIDDNIHKLYPGESDEQIASRIGVYPWLLNLKFRKKLE